MNEQTASPATSDLYLELITQPRPYRPNRLCVVVSDLHFTDGTVGYQNLGSYTWHAFYNTILQRCNTYHILPRPKINIPDHLITSLSMTSIGVT